MRRPGFLIALAACSGRLAFAQSRPLASRDSTVTIANVAAQPITVPLSPVQRAQLAKYQQAAQDIAHEQQVYMTAILSSAVDPARVAAWTMTLTDAGIVLTPPSAKPDSTPPHSPPSTPPSTRTRHP